MDLSGISAYHHCSCERQANLTVDGAGEWAAASHRHKPKPADVGRTGRRAFP